LPLHEESGVTSGSKVGGHACSANLRFWVRGLLAERRELRVDWSKLVAVEEPLGFGTNGGFTEDFYGRVWSLRGMKTRGEFLGSVALSKN
jgi:hypothetical protein